MKVLVAILSISLLVVSAITLVGVTIVAEDSYYAVYSRERDTELPSKNPADWITVKEFSFAQCRNTTGNQADIAWMIAVIENSDQRHSARGSAIVTLFDDAGNQVGDRFSSEVTIPPGGETYLLDNRLLRSGLAITLSERRNIARVKMDFLPLLGSPYELRLMEQDGTESNYNWDMNMIKHIVTPESFPEHKIYVRVTNTGNAVLHRVKGVAAIYDSEDRLVDMLWSEDVGSWPTGRTIRRGSSSDLELNSISKSGRCHGAYDPNGYQVRYWIDALTASGQPLNKAELCTFCGYEMDN